MQLNSRKIRELSLADLKALAEIFEQDQAIANDKALRAAAKKFWQEVNNILAEKFEDLHTPDPEPHPFDFREWLATNGWECLNYEYYQKKYLNYSIKLEIKDKAFKQDVRETISAVLVEKNNWIIIDSEIPATATEAQTLFRLFRL